MAMTIALRVIALPGSLNMSDIVSRQSPVSPLNCASALEKMNREVDREAKRQR